MHELLSNIARWSIEVVYSFGYPGVFLLALLSSLNLPIPEPLVLALAGFLVGQGRFSFVAVVVASAAGAVAAALILYVLGLWFGERRLRRLVKRIERFTLISESDLDKAAKVFERYGKEAILIGHVLPVGGSLISVPAGLKRMSVLPFMLYTALGSVLWNGAFLVLGWWLGTRWFAVQEYASTIERVTLVAIACGMVWFLWRRWRARGRLSR